MKAPRAPRQSRAENRLMGKFAFRVASEKDISADGQDSDPPLAGSSGKKQKARKRKRISWAQLLKRTFKIDVLKCDKCGGRMKLVGVVFDQPTITTTLRALGLPVRAPPIAPARSRQLLDCDNSNDWSGADVDYGWPD